MHEGKWYLFAVPFFFTFVGRYVRHVDFQTIEIRDAVYFTRTGATFDILCTKGMAKGENGSKYHKVAQAPDHFPTIPAAGPHFPWLAPTPWVDK
jgi:hypothetical protein